MIRLRFERLQRGLSQQTVGVLARVHQPTLALIENERMKPSPAVLARLSSVFNVPADALLKPVTLAESEERHG